MNCNERERIKEAKINIKLLYPWLTQQEIEFAYNKSVADFIIYSYPSKNGRPTVETLTYDGLTVQWIFDRMLDIFSRAGGTSASAYRENGIDIKYGSSYIDPKLVMRLGLPKAGVPK